MDNVIYPSFGGGSCSAVPSHKKSSGDVFGFRKSLRAIGAATLKFNFYTVTLGA